MGRVSSIIRGQQVAKHIGAKYNPEDGFGNDVCIYVKMVPAVPEEGQIRQQIYIDIIDEWRLTGWLQDHPEITVIVCSRMDYDTLLRTVKNKVIFIPQHHANFERNSRTRGGITTLGVIGTPPAFPMLPEGLEDELSKRGMNLLTFSHFTSRQDIVDFYQKIDVQIVWRPYEKTLANPLKLVNGAAFGVPTIALDEPCFHELLGYYFPVKNFRELLGRLDSLKNDPKLYADYSERCIRRAEDYHIDNISKMYKNLSNHSS